jgi:hypothetical protein
LHADGYHIFVARAVFWNLVALHFSVELVFQNILIEILATMDLSPFPINRYSLESRVSILVKPSAALP